MKWRSLPSSMVTVLTYNCITDSFAGTAATTFALRGSFLAASSKHHCHGAATPDSNADILTWYPLFDTAHGG